MTLVTRETSTLPVKTRSFHSYYLISPELDWTGLDWTKQDPLYSLVQFIDLYLIFSRLLTSNHKSRSVWSRRLASRSSPTNMAASRPVEWRYFDVILLKSTAAILAAAIFVGDRTTASTSLAGAAAVIQFTSLQFSWDEERGDDWHERYFSQTLTPPFTAY